MLKAAVVERERVLTIYRPRLNPAVERWGNTLESVYLTALRPPELALWTVKQIPKILCCLSRLGQTIACR